MTCKNKIIAAVVAVALILACSVGHYVSLRQDIWDIINTPLASPEYYTPKSYSNYQEALTNAEEIAADLFAEEQEIDDAAEELQRSIDGLLKYADKEPLQQVLDAAAELDSAYYIPISWQPVAEALAKANAVMQDKNAVDDDVLNVIQEIDTAVNGLVGKPDKTELSEQYNTAAAIDTSIYRPSTVSILSAALSNANSILENENAIDTDVNSAVSELEKAVAGLDLIPDKTELQSAIDDAANYAEETYTTVTYKALQEALVSAKTVVTNDDSTQAQVDEALATLTDSIDGLVKSTKCVWRISTYLHKTATNHVGNSWSSGVFYNGEQVRGSFEVTAREGSGITITGKAVENDKIPDVGSGSVYLTLKDGNEAETTFYVRENRGRYAGNRAVWVLEVSCEIIERV